MGHFFGWVITELGEYALFSFLARFSRTQWIVFLTAAVLCLVALTGELTWLIAAAILFGAMALWTLLSLIDLGFNKIMRRH